jgi:hypothetical protein
MNPKNVLLPPLHIKQGLVKNFVKALDKSGEGFPCLRSKFSNLHHTKVKQGISDCPLLRTVLFHENFRRKLNSTVLAVRKSFKSLVCFLDNKKDKNFPQITQSPSQNYRKSGYRKSLKIHLRFSGKEPLVMNKVNEFLRIYPKQNNGIKHT